jgi:hypothetical protein
MALIFPIDSGLDERPFVVFTCRGTSTSVIALPIPGSLQFGDGATYNNTELGIYGNFVSNIASSVSKNGLGIDSLKGALGAEVGKIKAAYDNSTVGSIMQAATALSGAGEGIQSAISIGTGTTVNKNITTEFTATNTRVFSFQFQLIPRTISEGNEISKIVKTFRENLYPEGDEFQLKYPPKWNIEFKVGGKEGGSDISHLPKIGDTYLTEVSTTYNGSSNTWRSDGSPLETTIQVQFIETKAHRKDTLPQ